LLLVAFLLVNAPDCHLSLVLASIVQGDAVNCNSRLPNLGVDCSSIGPYCVTVTWSHIFKGLLQVTIVGRVARSAVLWPISKNLAIF